MVGHEALGGKGYGRCGNDRQVVWFLGWIKGMWSAGLKPEWKKGWLTCVEWQLVVPYSMHL